MPTNPMEEQLEIQKVPKNKKSMMFYLGSLLSIFTLLCLLFYFYVNKQQFTIEKVPPLLVQQLVEDGRVEVIKDGLGIEISEYEWNQLLKGSIEQLKIIKKGKIEQIHWDKEDGTVAFTVQGKNGKKYSMRADAEIVAADSGMKIQLSDYRMGAWNSRLLGMIYKIKLGGAKVISPNLANDSQFLVVKSMDTSVENAYILKLDYQLDILAKRIADYQDEIDSAKYVLQTKNGTINEDLLEIIKADKINEKEAEKFISILSKDEEVLTELALVLNESGIQTFLQDFKPIYAKSLNIDKVIEKSESELNQNIRAYHYDFSRMLLHYLYNNPQYTVNEGKIYVNGAAVSGDIIFNANQYKKIYEVEVASNDKYIQAIYTIGDATLTKNVLRKGRS